jgi:hypothetical protein
VKGTLTVQAGQKLSNVNFILNGTPPRFDQFEDGEVKLQRPPFLFLRERRMRMMEKAS